MSAKTWLILPTYNEAGNILPFIESVSAVLQAELGSDYKILVVDDNSPDGTGEIADQISTKDNRVAVLHRTEKEGLGPAYIAGFKRALAENAQFILEMDSDFSHRPEDLKKLLVAANAGADLVIGSRYTPGGAIEDWSKLRRKISSFGCIYARSVLGLKIGDLTGGFKCFRAEVLKQIGLDEVRSRGYAFQVELTYRAIKRGFKVVEVPITFRERNVGESKMSWQIMLEAAWLLPLLRRRVH